MYAFASGVARQALPSAPFFFRCAAGIPYTSATMEQRYSYVEWVYFYRKAGRESQGRFNDSFKKSCGFCVDVVARAALAKLPAVSTLQPSHFSVVFWVVDHLAQTVPR